MARNRKKHKRRKIRKPPKFDNIVPSEAEYAVRAVKFRAAVKHVVEKFSEAIKNLGKG